MRSSIRLAFLVKYRPVTTLTDTHPGASPMELEAERLKLEREAIAVERERLEAARVYAEAEAKLARARRPVSLYATSVLFAALAFVGGVIWGYSISERQRDQRLRDTLSRLDTLGGMEDGTNAAVRVGGRTPLSVTVIQ